MAAEAKGGEASPRPHLRRYFALDAFRGLAAVAVAIFHFRWTHPELSTCGIFERLVNLLDFFFVLGGFVPLATHSEVPVMHEVTPLLH